MFAITTFYKFIRQNNLEEVQSQLEAAAEKFDIKGLIIVGAEGLNATVTSKSVENLNLFKEWVKGHFASPDLMFKDSRAETAPFRRFKVKIRNEIVTLGTPDLFPDGKNHHLTPNEWNHVLKEEDDFVMIDTRNWYETKLGTFKGALDPKIDQFTEFPEFVEKSEIPKDKKMLIFCTGGIRCEKGLLELQRRGYNNVYQLEGGILKYLEEYPDDQFQGECFVFDHRVAVDQKLLPSSQYKLCPHCGQPAATPVDCKRCDTHSMICETCADKEFLKDTCTKNCAYQYQMHPGVKALRQALPFEIEKRRPE